MNLYKSNPFRDDMGDSEEDEDLTSYKPVSDKEIKKQVENLQERVKDCFRLLEKGDPDNIAIGSLKGSLRQLKEIFPHLESDFIVYQHNTELYQTARRMIYQITNELNRNRSAPNVHNL